ncbi:MAG: tRNA (N6-isopentenyl adenosine(37)-C2)-methylthiotransferase MiaB [bacterium]
MSKRVFIETYGCQMNVYDSELVKSILVKHKYHFVDSEKDADVVMLNTCSIRENATFKIYNRVHEIKRHHSTGKVKVGILGCMATNFKTELLENKKLKIDFIAGPDSYKVLPQLIEASTETGQKSFDVTLSEFETYEDVYPSRQDGVNAWIAIMRGCNNFCTFCVVPYTRGRERSRSVVSILDEVKRLRDEGYEQVTLLGQNVNSYKHGEDDFTELMDQVSQVEGIKRIRFTSPHPKDFPLKLLTLMAQRPNICNQIHLPLQAGNDRILKKMNRSYTKEEFLNLVALIKNVIPNVSLSTDIICGFCSETAEEFEDTLDVVRRVEFDSAFVFKYSERPNTRASQKFEDDVSEAEKTRRIMTLLDIQNQISLSKHKKMIGQTQRVLVERVGTKRDPLSLQTRNDANTLVILPAHERYKQGDWLDVCVTDATRNVLKAEFT